MIELQYQLEELYNKNMLKPRLKAWFDSLKLLPEEHELYKSIRKACVNLTIQKRIKAEAMIGMTALGDVPYEQAVQFLEALVTNGYCFFDYRRNEFVVKFEPDKQTQLEIDTFQFPPPMVVQPEPLVDNDHCGYVLAQESVMTAGSETKQDVCLDVLDILNSFEMQINTDILKFDNKHKSFHQKSEKETVLDFQKRQQQWLKFDQHTRYMVKEIYHDKSLWFNHKYDARGRLYCKGYHLNYQGGSWHKAVIQLIPEHLEND